MLFRSERESNKNFKDIVSTDHSIPCIPYEAPRSPVIPLGGLRSPHPHNHVFNHSANSGQDPHVRKRTSSPKGLYFLDPLESPLRSPLGEGLKGSFSEMISPLTKMSTGSKE